MLITAYGTGFCAACYKESAYRAAAEQADPGTAEIIRRAADALVARLGVTADLEKHARHTRRTRPWPSQLAA